MSFTQVNPISFKFAIKSSSFNFRCSCTQICGKKNRMLFYSIIHYRWFSLTSPSEESCITYKYLSTHLLNCLFVCAPMKYFTWHMFNGKYILNWINTHIHFKHKALNFLSLHFFFLLHVVVISCKINTYISSNDRHILCLYFNFTKY